MRLKGKSAIVTGAGSGIGRAIALKLAEDGAEIVAADINEEPAKSVAEAICAEGGQAIGTATDITMRASIDAMEAAAIENFGKIDILINNAGTNAPEPFIEVSEINFDCV